jgi:hypothetical protein
MHPYVYSWEHAICDAGVPGLDRRDGFSVHVFVEAELDMMMLNQRRYCTFAEVDYDGDILASSNATLELLDSLYKSLALEVYGKVMPERLYSRAVKDMRISLNFLRSPSGIKRYAFGQIEGVFSRYSKLMAMSPRIDVGTVSDFDNRDHREWKHASTGEICTASFDELYALALGKVAAEAPALMGAGSIADVTDGLNFNGEPIIT